MISRNDLFVKREYKKALLPVVLSVLGGTVNTLIDSAFVSQSEGEDALAAINLCMPIYLTLCVLGSLFAGGASVLSSREIGNKRMDESSRMYYSALALYLVSGIVVMAVGIPLMRPLSAVLAHGGELVEYVYSYGLVTIIGAFPAMLIYLPTRYLQLEGMSKQIARMMALMILVDVVLDYLVLFIFHLGVGGAAAASVIATALACLYGFISLQSGRNYRFYPKKIKIYRALEIIKYGSPSAMGNLLDAIRMIILNSLILSTLGSHGMAVWGVLNSLSELSISVTTGVPQTALPMIGVYYPSRENSAIRSLIRLQFKWGTALLLIYGAIISIGHNFIGIIFKTSSDLLIPLICLSLSMLVDLVLSIWSRYLNAIGMVIFANILNVFRKFLAPVCMAYIFAPFGTMFWAFLPVSGVIVVLLGGGILIMLRRDRARRGKVDLSRILLLDDSLEREKLVLDFSIQPTDEAACDAAEKISEFCALHRMDRKIAMKLSLSIEELLVVIIRNIPGTESIDLRAFVIEQETGLQIRCAGRYYNPFEESEQNPDDDDMMGVIMMKKMARSTDHYYALGINTLHIFFTST